MTEESGSVFVCKQSLMLCVCVCVQDSGTHLSVIDDSNEHMLTVWDWQKKSKIAEIKVLGHSFHSFFSHISPLPSFLFFALILFPSLFFSIRFHLVAVSFSFFHVLPCLFYLYLFSTPCFIAHSSFISLSSLYSCNNFANVLFYQTTNEVVLVVEFHPTDANTIVTCGKSHIFFWTWSGSSLARKQGIFGVRTLNFMHIIKIMIFFYALLNCPLSFPETAPLDLSCNSRVQECFN